MSEKPPAAGAESTTDYTFPRSHDIPQMPAVGRLLGSDFTRLILVRHGETTHSIGNKFAGRVDIPLTDHGQEQARHVGERLARSERPIDAVVTSPLIRCRQTWESIRAGGGEAFDAVSFTTADELVELDFGDWDGRDFSDVYAEYGNDVFAAVTDINFRPPGGENAIDVDRRVQSIRERILREYSNRTVLVVTHMTPVLSVLRWALSAGPSYMFIQTIDTASISVVDVYPTGSVAVRTVNNTEHLPSA